MFPDHIERVSESNLTCFRVTLNVSPGQIMAGIDDGYNGDAAPARWANIGYLQQEPELTEVSHMI